MLSYVRAIWKGAVSFGLVNVPVKLYAATQDHDVRFHQVHETDGGRVRMKRVCEVCGETVTDAEIAKGFQDPSGQTVIMTVEDLQSLPVSDQNRNIEVLEFVPTAQIDPILYDKSYYLEPEKRTVKPYVLLRDALGKTDRTAIVKVAIRQRTQLACLRIQDQVLLLQTLKWPDEVRQPDFDFQSQDVAIRPQELAMAESLIESLASDFDPDEFSDNYRDAVVALLDTKLAGGDTLVVESSTETAGTGDVIDLMAALRESVKRSGGTLQEDAPHGDTTADPPRPKSATAQKAAGPKPAAKKATTAKKAATRKPAAKKAATGKQTADQAPQTKKTAPAKPGEKPATAKNSPKKTA